MKKALSTLVQSAKTILHLDHYADRQKWRLVLHQLIITLLIILTFVRSAQERLIAVGVGIITISYLPFITIELYHRPRMRNWYWYGGIAVTALWTLSGIIHPHLMINALRSAGFLTIGWWIRDYCVVIRRWKTWNIYNQVSTIGIFLVSIVFGILSMRRFQAIDFSCTNINFLSTKFLMSANADPVRASLVTDVVASGGRANYLQLLDRWLNTSSEDTSLANTIKTQVRNGVIVVMDQKQLYDKSVCDYVTTALNNNYQKPSFFYSGVLLLTFIGLAPARIALIIIASIFSLILWGLHRLGFYRSHATMIEHQVLE